jgi:hypothetical protein
VPNPPYRFGNLIPGDPRFYRQETPESPLEFVDIAAKARAIAARRAATAPESSQELPRRRDGSVDVQEVLARSKKVIASANAGPAQEPSGKPAEKTAVDSAESPKLAFIDWVRGIFHGPRSTRTATLLARSAEITARTDKLLADLALEKRGFHEAICERCREKFETSDDRQRCNACIGTSGGVRRIAVCDFPGCKLEFVTFTDRTRCDDHAGRTPR